MSLKLASGTVTNAAGITLTSVGYGIEITGGDAAVINAGVISVTGFNSVGIKLPSGGSVTNFPGGRIYSRYFGIVADGAAATITNAGTINGHFNFGIRLNNGGYVQNLTGGTIFGGTTGISIAGGGTVSNAGTITKGIYRGDLLDFAANSTNRLIVRAGAIFAGTVEGGNHAGSPFVSTLELASSAAAGTLSGLGTQFRDFVQTTIDSGAAWTLTGSNTVGYGYSLTNNGTLTNTGRLVTVGTFVNAGYIAGNGTIDLRGAPLTGPGAVSSSQHIVPAIGATLASGVLINAAGSLIAGGSYGVYAGGAGTTVNNKGTINGYFGTGIHFAAVGSVTNAATGSILGGYDGIVFGSRRGRVINAGTIAATIATDGEFGIWFTNGAYLKNQAGGVISGSTGVYNEGAIGTILNSGQIIGTFGNGVSFLAKGYIRNETSGTIYGLKSGLYAASGVSTIVNAGTITAGQTAGINLVAGGIIDNRAGGYILGKTVGVTIGGGGTVTNGGTIAADFDQALTFRYGYTNRLIVQPGAVFNGRVDGGNAYGWGYVSTLELASAAAAGTLSGLGAQFKNFLQTTVDLGAVWTLTGKNTMSAYYSLTNAGTLTNNGVLVERGTFFNTGYLGGTGAVVLMDQGVFNGPGSVGGGQRVVASIGTSLASGNVVNEAGDWLGGGNVAVSFGSYGTVTNAGIISGYDGTGIAFYQSGNVDNQSTGTIGGGYAGVFVGTGQGTIVNSGQILSNAGDSVYLRSGGYLNNNGGATIAGAIHGVFLYSGYGSIINAGTIAGSEDDGIRADSYVSITNAASGTIFGTYDAVALYGYRGTVVNAGVIKSDSGGHQKNIGVLVEYDGFVSNMSTGTITGQYFGIRTEMKVTVVNSGYVEGRKESGISIWDFGYIRNQLNGRIAGLSDGIYGYSGTILNAGSISGHYNYGVQLLAGGVLSNASSGTISGAVRGVVGNFTSGTIINAGSIYGGGTSQHSAISGQAGVAFAGGWVINQASGTITGKWDGIQVFSGSVINAGHIAGGIDGIGLSSGFIANMDTGTIAVSTADSNHSAILAEGGPVTVDNAGNIVGAVRFDGSFSNRLIVRSGASFSSPVTVSGGAGSYTSTLELASSASVGVFTGLGTKFTGFASTTIDAGAAWTLNGANTLSAGNSLTNNGTLTVLNSALTDTGTITNNGTIIVGGTTQTIAALSGTGVVLIGDSDTLVSNAGVSAGETISFSTARGTFNLDPLQFHGTIARFQAGDTVRLAQVTHVSTAIIVNSNTLEVTQTGGPTLDLTLDPGRNFSGGTFTVTSGGVITTNETLPCFLHDTAMRTEHGDIAVQYLVVGDMVETLSGAFRPIRWIGRRGLDLTRHPEPQTAYPIRIRAGALADGVPSRDLLVSPDHALLLDGVLIPARLLINGSSIVRDAKRQNVIYYHIELDSHDILLAEGAAAESYLDTGNRGIFERADGPLRLHPDLTNDQGRREAESCVPFSADADRIWPVWQALRDRAAMLGLVPADRVETTADPDLRIQAGGRSFRPIVIEGTRYVFVLPAWQGDLRLLSLRAKPSDEKPWVDDQRQLGVMVRRITIRAGMDADTIPVDHPALGSGWWDVECGPQFMGRWTDGDAVVTLALDRPCQFVVDVAATMQYPTAVHTVTPVVTRFETGLEAAA